MSPLRILHVVPYYEHAWAYGGIPRAATALTRGLARRGHHVTVYTTDACNATARTTKPSGNEDPPGTLDVRVFRNLSNYLAYHWQLFTPAGLVTQLRRSAASFDIAHLHACHNLLSAIAARVLRRQRVPYVVSPHGTAPAIERRVFAKRMFERTAGRHILPGARRVLAVSQAERQQLVAMNIGDARITVASNPIDDREFDPRPDAASFRRQHGLGDAPLVLMLSKLTPRKGGDVLLRAFGQLRRRDAQLVIAGSDMGSGLPSLDDKPDGTRLHRIGVLSGRGRLEALAAADVVVYPSRDEVFGLVPIEALLCGSPVVVCSDSGCGEIIGTVGGGHIVPYGDASALAGAIDSILDGSTLWRQRAAAAATRARARFGADEVCKQLERVYEDVLGRRAPGDRRSA
jgi:glycosyltransferase involved in cell wall biosynthesis